MLVSLQWHDATPEDLDEARLRDCGFASRDEFLTRYPGAKFQAPADDADLQEFYLHGMCAPFALALADRTGWELVGLHASRDADDPPVHLLCRAPDGTLADARGWGLDADMAMEGMSYARHLLPATRETVLRFLRHPGIHRLAAAHVDDLLVPGFGTALAP